MTEAYGNGALLDRLEVLRIKRGMGLVDCHRHLASEHTITEERYESISDGKHLNEKWKLMDALRREPWYLDSLPSRLESAIGRMREQGIRFCRTYAEVDAHLGIHVVEAMLEARERWKGSFTLQVAAYPFQGLGDKAKRKRAEQALEKADLLGCLPSRGRRDVSDEETSRENMMLLFAFAHEQKKPIDLQIDQDNHPKERETFALIKVAREFREKGYEQSITATHCISLGAQFSSALQWALPRMRELNIQVVTCPSAALGMKQPTAERSPTRNSIAPVTEFLEAGILVGIGSDNVSDLYEPFTTGDIREEMGKMLSAIRWTGSLETIADIMTTNGRKILGV